MWELLLLLLPVAAASGWMAARKHYLEKKPDAIPQDYFKGLNFLLNEQPDKAVEIFINLLEVNPDTVETHLALGHLFRKRGEVDRAIRIHQNVIARPHLSKAQRNQALHALATDYLSAGVLDRSERLFLDAIDINARDLESLHNLLDIYQQEKSWMQAIAIAKKLESATSQSYQRNITHYYCELSEIAIQNKELGQARALLKQAFSSDKYNARALILQSNMQADLKDYTAAIKSLTLIKDYAKEYFSETLTLLHHLHKKNHTESAFYDFLHESLKITPCSSSALLLAQHQSKEDPQGAITFLVSFLQKNASLNGLIYLLELQSNFLNDQNKHQTNLLLHFLKKIASTNPKYLCQHCGFTSKTLLWLCPSCKQWNTIKPIRGLVGE